MCVFQADRPVLMMGEQDVVNVIEGQSFNLSCLVSVPANIDSKVINFELYGNIHIHETFLFSTLFLQKDH